MEVQSPEGTSDDLNGSVDTEIQGENASHDTEGNVLGTDEGGGPNEQTFSETGEPVQDDDVENIVKETDETGVNDNDADMAEMDDEVD